MTSMIIVLCIEEEFLRNNVFSLYDLYGHALVQEPLTEGNEARRTTGDDRRHPIEIGHMSYSGGLKSVTAILFVQKTLNL